VSREFILEPLQRLAELFGGDLRGDARFRRAFRVPPADAAAEAGGQAGFAAQPQAVAQPFQRVMRQAAERPYSGANGSGPEREHHDRDRALGLRLQLLDPIGAQRGWHVQRETTEQLGRAGTGAEPRQRSTDEHDQPPQPAPRQDDARTDPTSNTISGTGVGAAARSGPASTIRCEEGEDVVQVVVALYLFCEESMQRHDGALTGADPAARITA